jgi:FMN phosphatase YigB (HAD superfamily)
VGALNNEARETNEFRFEKFGLRKYFEVALSSCYLGLRKPEAAIYKRALDILGGRRSGFCLSTIGGECGRGGTGLWG